VTGPKRRDPEELIGAWAELTEGVAPPVRPRNLPTRDRGRSPAAPLAALGLAALLVGGIALARSAMDLSDSTTSPQPSTTIASPSASPHRALRPGSLAEGARQASISTGHSGHGERIGSLLAGERVLVLDEAVDADEPWYRVQFWGSLDSPFGLHPDTIVGWVEGSALAPVEPDCPARPTLQAVARLAPYERLLCFGDRPLTFDRVFAGTFDVGSYRAGPPMWLSVASNVWLSTDGIFDFYSSIPFHVHPTSGVDVPLKRWLRVTGQFDYPVAQQCGTSRRGGDLADEDRLWCRQQFVVTAAEPAGPPDSELRGEWRHIADAPIQSRIGHTAVWTGTEMVVWGGRPFTSGSEDTRRSDGTEGAAYDPVKDSWRLLAPSPIAGRQGHVAAWTGTELLVWGGTALANDQRLGDGAAYDPAKDRWRVLPAAPLPDSGYTSAAWTGRLWIVIDGMTDGEGMVTAAVAAYDPTTDAWTSFPSLEVPASWAVVTTWTGQEVLLIAHPNAGHSVGFMLHLPDPWVRLPDAPFDGLNAGLTGVWTGNELLVGAQVEDEAGTRDQVFGFDESGWRTAASPPRAIRGIEPIWTGTMAIFFSGGVPADAYDPTRDRWFSLPAPGEAFREFAQGIWAGDRFIAWGGEEGESGYLHSDGMAFVPDATYVDAPMSTGDFNVRVEVVDASGGLVSARSATPAELEARGDTFASSFLDVSALDERTLLVRWVGGPADKSARLEVGASGKDLLLIAVPTYGDLAPAVRGVVLVLDHPISLSDLSVRLVDDRS
jgi:hypothetical protein